ncbi:MAG: hypothetical protein CL931_15605 [Deltaproteobacteria bacterium]|nr:hypothetical protein [Deltaproteobacteria bacterium]
MLPFFASSVTASLSVTSLSAFFGSRALVPCLRDPLYGFCILLPSLTRGSSVSAVLRSAQSNPEFPPT